MTRGRLFFLALLLCACSRLGGGKVRLLVATPLTGEMAAEGLGVERAVRMAVEDETALGGLPPVEVVVADDKNDPFTASAVARNAVDDPAVFAVIGHVTSGCAIEASRVYAQGPLAMITPSATAPLLTLQQDQPGWNGEHVVFRLPPADNVQGEVAADYAATRLSLKRFVLVHDRTPYGQGLVEAFQAALKRKGASVTHLETVAFGEKDFSPVAKVIRADDPDAVFFGGLSMEAGLLIKQARAAGYRGVFMAGDGVKTPEFLETAGAASNGAYITVHGVPVEALPSAADFLERYQKRWSSPPRASDHYGYEAARVALAALRKAGPDRMKIIEALRDTNLRTMVGDIVFDSKGDTLKGLVTVTKADYARRRFDVSY